MNAKVLLFDNSDNVEGIELLKEICVLFLFLRNVSHQKLTVTVLN